MKRIFALIVGASVALSSPVMGQADDQTLADIRQELSVLFVEVQKLKRELSTTGGVGTAAAGGSVLQRVDAIEAELQRLTSKTEVLENRVNTVVKDGTNRVGDLEFRLCELESGCDIGNMAETSTLGGGSAPANTPAVAVTAPTTDTTQMAVGEQADFERAQAALASGDFRSAADQFTAFTQTYPGGPLSARAHLGRGEAHENLGEMRDAARAYLNSYSGAPDGPVAPKALFKLGSSLAALGQNSEACVTLAEVEARYPSSDQVLEARSTMRNLGCS